MNEDMNEQMNEQKNNEKKVRWDIAMAMGCVFETLSKSKLKIKKSKKYETALGRLKELYKLTVTQVWILSLVCERYVENDDTSSLSDLSDILEVPAMSIMSWKKDIDLLVEKRFLSKRRWNGEVSPVGDFCHSVYNNTEYIPRAEKEIDEIEFLDSLSELYESRHREDLSAERIHEILNEFEYKHKTLDLVKRVKKEIKVSNHRFILYDIAHDVMNGDESNLNSTICDLYDGNERFRVSKQMMEESHVLFTKRLLEFEKKGNLSDATVTLSSKGKKLLLGDKAFLFEDSINEKNLIKTDAIKSKTLFYSKENQKDIDRLKNALQEDKLRGIQKRLRDDGLPVGVAVLLYGAPGTGKTESVMQIAKETGRSIVHVDISEAKSAWFGESEKRMKKIFTSYKNACEIAQKKRELMPILLFNEADALISKRKDSNAGNCAQTENAIQNIILEELESIQGIFIATTNLASNMDAAFERRFLFKIKFENPSTEAKTSIWMNKLSWLGQEEASEFARDYDFSGGQIDNIVRKVAMNEVINGTRPDIAEIHEMCKSEKLENPDGAKRMGFCL